MVMGIEYLNNVFTLPENGNIDSRYFADNGDGTYKLTPTFIHDVLRDAFKYYKNRIFKLDSGQEYHSEKTWTFVNKWPKHIAEQDQKLKYGEQLKELERRKRAWREANVDKCNRVSGGPEIGDEDEKRFISGYKPEFEVTLNTAVANYKFLKDYLKENEDTIKASIPQMPDRVVIKDEYSEEYKKLCDQWAQELGIPVISEKILNAEPVTDIKYTIARIRSEEDINKILASGHPEKLNPIDKIKPSDDNIQDFTDGLIKYIVSSNKYEYKQKLIEGLKIINEEFVTNVNENAKFIKAEEEKTGDTVTAINIYSKSSDDSNAEKLVIIEKKDPSDPTYKYTFTVDFEGETYKYTKEIATKADIITAIKSSRVMIESNPKLYKYVEDFDRILEHI